MNKIIWYVWFPVRRFFNVVVIPNIPVTCIRLWLYRLIGFKIGRNCYIGMKCYLDDRNPSMTILKDGAVISYDVKMAIHGINQHHTPIVLEEGSYVGCGSVLISGKQGITIGKQSIIGAGSVVVSSTPDHSTAVGNPARVIKINSQKENN